jgi:hypothetical protein
MGDKDLDDQEERLGHPQIQECRVCAKNRLPCAASCGAHHSAGSIGNAIRTGQLRPTLGLSGATVRHRDKTFT